MLSKPSVLLRLEGAVVLLLSVACYQEIRARWLLFAILFLAPDLFMLGYLADARLGSAIYNLAHTLLSPAILLAIAFFGARPRVFPLGLIWTAHIGFDRLLGFGLKYPTHFKDTHLQHV